MAKKTTSTKKAQTTKKVSEILGLDMGTHLVKYDESKKVYRMTRAGFDTLKFLADASDEHNLTESKSKVKGIESIWNLKDGKGSAKIHVIPQVHNVGDSRATQKSFKIMGTSWYDKDGLTRNIKVDYYRPLKVYQIWSNAHDGKRSTFKKLIQSPKRDEVFKAYEKACKEAKSSGFKVKKVTPELENLNELIG